jgi:hypothetical protein
MHFLKRILKCVKCIFKMHFQLCGTPNKTKFSQIIQKSPPKNKNNPKNTEKKIFVIFGVLFVFFGDIFVFFGGIFVFSGLVFNFILFILNDRPLKNLTTYRF